VQDGGGDPTLLKTSENLKPQIVHDNYLLIYRFIDLSIYRFIDLSIYRFGKLLIENIGDEFRVKEYSLPITGYLLSDRKRAFSDVSLRLINTPEVTDC
jgi:hypothetical protein